MALVVKRPARRILRADAINNPDVAFKKVIRMSFEGHKFDIRVDFYG